MVAGFCVVAMRCGISSVTAARRPSIQRPGVIAVLYRVTGGVGVRLSEIGVMRRIVSIETVCRVVADDARSMDRHERG